MQWQLVGAGFQASRLHTEKAHLALLFGRELIPVIDLESHPAGHGGIGLPVGCLLERSEVLVECFSLLVSFLPFAGTILNGSSDRTDPLDAEPPANAFFAAA